MLSFVQEKELPKEGLFECLIKKKNRGSIFHGLPFRPAHSSCAPTEVKHGGNTDDYLPAYTKEIRDESKVLLSICVH